MGKNSKEGMPNQVKIKMYEPTDLQAIEQQFFRQREAEKQKHNFDPRHNSFYRQGLHGYVSFKNQEEKVPKVFTFPLSRQGLQTVNSKKELAYKLRTKFRQVYPYPQMQCPYKIFQARSPGPMKDQQFKMVAHCKICTNSIAYVKNMFTDNTYKLVKMVEYHVHGHDPHKVEQILRKNFNYSRFLMRQNGRPMEIKPIYLNPTAQTNIAEFMKTLPVELSGVSRRNIVCQRFNISQAQFDQEVRMLNSEYQISFKELINRLQNKCFTYRYLPANLLQINQEYIEKKRISELKFNLDQNYSKKKGIHDIDELNPDIPNVLLIVTPQMKELFHRHGQYVGFDLTFSLIKEKPTYEKEYFVGVFAGTSESRKILVFGLCLTNSQSQASYRFIFEQWLAAMGKGPQSFVTDEQQSLFFAVRSLQRDGLWNGQHLFDTFHILKKFRKSVEPNIFQLMRKMIHSRNRYDYRAALRQAMKEVHNQQQMQVLRAFDQNAEKYCFTQCSPLFIGIGISDAINEKYHDLMKAQLPYQVSYIKGVSVILDIIQKRNENNKFGIIDKNPIQQKMGLPFMKPYRTILSDKMFQFLLKEVYRSLPYDILTKQEERAVNHAKFQDGQPLLISPDSYNVIANGRIFRVHLNQGGPMNQHKRKGGKWQCDCEFQQKSGYPCSHLIKVLMHLELDFYDNINPRWLIRQELIDQGLIKFIFRSRKYHNFTRVRMRKRPRWVDDKDQDEIETTPQKAKNVNYTVISDDSQDQYQNQNEPQHSDDISTFDPPSNSQQLSQPNYDIKRSDKRYS